MYGLDVTPIHFFKEYMGKRTQRTNVNGHVLGKAKVTCGTAQGLLLGPLIFILYINDIFKSIPHKPVCLILIVRQSRRSEVGSTVRH